LPVSFEKMADKGRANASVPPPAGNGTMRFTGFVGHVACAQAGMLAASDVPAAHCKRFLR